VANPDDKSPANPKLEADSIPVLPPRTWWFYLAVAEAQSLEALVSSSGLVPSSVRAHMRKLSNGGLVRTDSAGRYVHARSLPLSVLKEVTERVARANFPGEPGVPIEAKHEVGFHNPVQRGSEWHTIVRCACGWRKEVLAGDANTVSRQARALWMSHAPKDAANWNRARSRANVALVIGGLTALAVVCVVAFGILQFVGGLGSDNEKGGLYDDGIDWSQQCGTLMVIARDDDQLATDRARALDLYSAYC